MIKLIITAHQPSYLPWLGYFHKCHISDIMVMLDSVQFEKNSFINRNKIKTSNGEIWLTVPIFMKGHINKLILDIEINNKINWREKHWKSIYLNYKKAPYFNRYSDFFEDLYKKDWLKLIDLLIYLISFFYKEFRIKTKIIRQSDLNIFSKKQNLILDLTKKLDGDIFVFGKMGKSYADIDFFNKNGVEVYFQDYIHPKYFQMWNEFIPNLSCIDLLFNEGPENALDIILKENVNKTR